MKGKSGSPALLFDGNNRCIRCVSPSLRRLPLSHVGEGRRHISRAPPPLNPKQLSRLAQARLDWEREKRHSLRTLLIQQYEEEERPKWSRTARRLEADDGKDEESVYWTSRDTSAYKGKRQRHEEVQCGIFWDIENVKNETHPPAVVIEAIRDFAGCRHTPVFQAYMSRPSLNLESRIHAIYAQLGVTFIQCYDLGKDTADKKIISDMWKFYASFQKSAPETRVRIILITGDRDFADAIGQLRNLGVEVGILTGPVLATAPVYDDYTLGMRVLPLLGVIQARARDIDLNAYQASRRLSLAEFEEKMNGDDFVDESIANMKDTVGGPARIDDNVGPAPLQKDSLNASQSATAQPLKPKTPEAKIDLEGSSITTTQQQSSEEAAQTTSTIPQDGRALKDSTVASEAKSQPRSPEETAQSANPSPVQSSEALSNNTDSARTGEGKVKESASEQTNPPVNNVRPTFGGLFARAKSFINKFTAAKQESSTSSGNDVQDTATETASASSADSSPETGTIKDEESIQPTTETKLPFTRKLTDPVPLDSSLFSASALRPPPFQTIINLSPSAATTGSNILSRIPWTSSPTTPSSIDLTTYYTTQILRVRPNGIDENEMRGIWLAWLRIEGWSGEEVNETSIRRCARLALGKAAEIVELRKEERDRKEEERKVAFEREKAVIDGVLGGKEKVWYPLTQERKGAESVESEEEAKKVVEEVIQQLHGSESEQQLHTPPGTLTNLDTSKVDSRKMTEEQRVSVLAELNKITEANQPLPEDRRRWSVDIKKPLTPQFQSPQPRDYSNRV